jgi:RNA polymerase sigma-70 factor (ECF subfamily)
LHISSFDISSKASDDNEFVRFFQKHYSSFCFFANGFVNDTDEAEDIVSEVAVRVWEKLDSIEQEAALKNYFYTSIRHACLRALENKKRRESKEKEYSLRYLSQPSTGLEFIIRTEMLGEVERLLSNLSPQCRKVFTKLYVEGKTETEAAEELDVSVNTIKFHRKKGLKLLRGVVTLIFGLLLSLIL